MVRSSKIIGPAVKAAVLVVGFIAAAAPVKPAYPQDENITVSCYKGNFQEGNNIGEITVNKAENAGRDCNNFYEEECQGECLGCIYDADLTQDVCYDNRGRKFLKPD